MESIFVAHKVNTGRQLELDVARGLAIVFMVLVHVFELFVGHPFPNTVSTYIISFLGAPPAAPVFMLLLGIGIVYSKRASAALLFKRGIVTLVLAYILALLRDAVPSYISYLVKGDFEIFWDGVLETLGVDILQFAGLAFLFFSLVKKLKLETWQMVSLMLVFCLMGAILGDTSSGVLWLDALGGLLWGTWERSWFPFVSWIFFPVAGYIFGTFLIHCSDKTQLYKRVLTISLLSLIPLVIISYNYGIEIGAFGILYQQQYYHQNLFGNIIFTLFSLFWISLLYFLLLFFENCSFNTLKRWSGNVTQIYVVHWLILGVLCQIIEGPINILTVVIMSAVILLVSDFIAAYYLKCKANYLQKKEGVSL